MLHELGFHNTVDIGDDVYPLPDNVFSIEAEHSREAFTKATLATSKFDYEILFTFETDKVISKSEKIFRRIHKSVAK